MFTQEGTIGLLSVRPFVCLSVRLYICSCVRIFIHSFIYSLYLALVAALIWNTWLKTVPGPTGQNSFSRAIPRFMAWGILVTGSETMLLYILSTSDKNTLIVTSLFVCLFLLFFVVVFLV